MATNHDNAQNYFNIVVVINERTDGLSFLTQQFGAISNYGVLANLRYCVKLSDKS